MHRNEDVWGACNWVIVFYVILLGRRTTHWEHRFPNLNFNTWNKSKKSCQHIDDVDGCQQLIWFCVHIQYFGTKNISIYRYILLKLLKNER